MKNSFIQNGNTFMPVDPDSLVIRDKLPVGVYNVGANEKGFFLQAIEGFSLPSKLYGNTIKDARRIFDTFMARPGTTGVTLTGEKGSGKTMLAKKLSIMGLDKDMPTIVINEPFSGDAFNRFIQAIEQPCVVLFDEFEKIYDRDQQSAMLTLLDGTFNSKKLFVLTCNDKYRIDSYMRNRPGRIFYSIDFRGLEEDFVSEYCADNLEVKEHVDGVLRIAKLFSQFNFDMLKALVEEMNRYGETASEAMRILNVRPEAETDPTFDVEIWHNGQPLPVTLNQDEFNSNPMLLRTDWQNYITKPTDKKVAALLEPLLVPLHKDRDGDAFFNVSPEGFEKTDADGGYIFSMKEQPELKVVFVKRRPRFVDYAY